MQCILKVMTSTPGLWFPSPTNTTAAPSSPISIFSQLVPKGAHFWSKRAPSAIRSRDSTKQKAKNSTAMALGLPSQTQASSTSLLRPALLKSSMKSIMKAQMLPSKDLTQAWLSSSSTSKTLFRVPYHTFLTLLAATNEN